MTSPLDLSLRHLAILLAVKREGRIGAASTAINMSQPALTHALARFEEQIGHRLFDRQARGSVPTEAGSLFAMRAEYALGHLIEGCRLMRRSARLPIIPHVERIIMMSQLRAVMAVARAGGYAQAARDTGNAQPSIHRSIKELEAILGVTLFTRNGRHMRPSPPTLLLLNALRLMQSELQAGLDDLGHLIKAGAGRIVVGALPLPRGRLLPEALALFTQDYAAAEISVLEGSYVDLINGLRDGEVDFVLSDTRDTSLAPDMVETELYTDAFFIVARTGHPLAGSSVPSAEQLARYPWIVGNPGTPLREIWEKLMDGRGPATRIDCGSVMTARRMLIDGDWLAILSPDLFDIEQRAGLITTIGGPLLDVQRRIGVTMRADWHPSAAKAAFFKILQGIAERRKTRVPISASI